MTAYDETDSTFTLSDTAWMSQANCVGLGRLMFTDDHSNATAAKNVCRGCVVRDDCLDYAITHSLWHDVWGGCSVRERKAISKQRREATLVHSRKATA